MFTHTKQTGVIEMKSNIIKSVLLIFFFLGITLSYTYAGSFTQKDSTSNKSQKIAKAGKCENMAQCKDKSECKNTDKCKDMSKCTNKNMNSSMSMSKTMKMDSKSADKVQIAKAINLKAIDKNKDGKVFQCPMDFDVLSDKPGKDPKCGMTLVEVTLGQAKKNLTDHGFKVK